MPARPGLPARPVLLAWPGLFARRLLLSRTVLPALVACWFAVLSAQAWTQPAAPLRAPGTAEVAPDAAAEGTTGRASGRARQDTAAQTPRAVPPLSSRVIDETGTLDAAQRAALDDKLAAFERDAGPQVVVLVVPTTQPEDIADFAQRVGDAWKIGRREIGDGLLVIVAKDDRRVRIAPAKALEGAVPDLAARQIIDQQMAPAFRQGDYAGGLNRAADALMARIRGEHLPPPARGGAAGTGIGGIDWGTLGLFLFVGVPLVGGMLSSVLGRKLGALVTAGGAAAAAWVLAGSLLAAAAAGVMALVLVGVVGTGAARGHGPRRGGFVPPVIWGGGGFGGGMGGGAMGGGGFSSGGGGNFGGGGASGRW
jgi:uncharacterized protein